MKKSCSSKHEIKQEGALPEPITIFGMGRRKLSSSNNTCSLELADRQVAYLSHQACGA